MNSNNTFLYELNCTSEHEIIHTNDNYLNNIIKEVDTYYSLPFTPNNIEVKKQLILGNYAFYILDTPNLNFDDITKKRIKLINLYLSNCIADKSYCNNNIFLAFVRDVLQVSGIHANKIFVSNYYPNELLEDIDIDNKLDLLLNNKLYFQLHKDYICQNIIDLIIASIFEIFEKNYLIKRCRNCNKYFYNKNSNKYCPYICNQDNTKSCYEYCSNTSYVDKRRNDPIQKKYTSIVNRFRNYCDYHSFKEGWEILGNFSERYCDNKKFLNNGEISREDILNFLDTYDDKFKNIVKERKSNGSSGNNKK